MRAYVEYNVPVLVEIDLDGDAVVAVRVDDEQVHGPTTVMAFGGHVLIDADAQRAIAVAEADSWPEWEFGL
jgi:hypothetical protein